MDRSSQPCASPSCNFNDFFIDCSGSCKQRFHAVCVGLSAASVPLITSSPNWFWFCDVCCDLTWIERIAAFSRPSESTVDGLSEVEENSCGSSNCIFTDQLVTCDGPCGKGFHGMCVSLSKNDLMVIGSSTNILWVCDECKVKVPLVRDDSDVGILEDNAEHVVNDDSIVLKLETKFESIIAKLSRLNTNLENGVYTPPDSLPNSEGNSDSEVSHEKDGQLAERPTVDSDVTVTEVTETEHEDIVSVEADVDMTKNDSESPDLLAMKEMLPAVESPKKDPVSIFTFGIVKPIEKPNFSFSIPTDCVDLFKKTLAEQKSTSPKLKLTKLEKDNNNNVPKPEIPPQETVPKRVEVIPTTRKDEFALWIKFDDPHITSRDVCTMVRETLGMSATDSVVAKNVVPMSIRFTSQALYSSFKIDMDARWRKKALDGATWRLVEDYRQHSEWVNR